MQSNPQIQNGHTTKFYDTEWWIPYIISNAYAE